MDVALRDQLLRAIVEDDADEIIRLLSAGAETGADPRHGTTAMRTACQEDALSSVRVLLELGVSANERSTYKSPVDQRIEQDFTPLFYAASRQIIDLLVQFGADVNAVSATGLSPLMRFAHFGEPERVDALLRHGADCSLRQFPKRGRKARTALEFARDSLAFWESLPKAELTPETEILIEDHRRTVDILAKASAS